MRYHRGFSLVGLMVGLALSLVVTVGLLSVFRNSVQVTATATASTIDDSKLSALLQRTGTAVHDAGFGITTPTFGVQIVAISHAAFSQGKLTGQLASVGTAANAVVWAMLTGPTTQCAGVYSPAGGGLMYLGPIACLDATQWASVNWTVTAVASQGSTTVAFTITQQSCAPFGITNTTGRYLLTLSTTDSISSSVRQVSCLLNFQ